MTDEFWPRSPDSPTPDASRLPSLVAAVLAFVPSAVTDAELAAIAEGAPLLTDDFAPADALISR